MFASCINCKTFKNDTSFYLEGVDLKLLKYPKLKSEYAATRSVASPKRPVTTGDPGHLCKALLAAHAAAQAHREAEIQVEEAKRSVGKQLLGNKDWEETNSEQ